MCDAIGDDGHEFPPLFAASVSKSIPSALLGALLRSILQYSDRTMTCSKLFLALAIAINEALRKAAAIETFAAASPITNVINQGIARGPRPYLNDKPTIRADHYFCLHLEPPKEVATRTRFNKGRRTSGSARFQELVARSYRPLQRAQCFCPRPPSRAGGIVTARAQMKAAIYPGWKLSTHGSPCCAVAVAIERE